MGIKVIFLDVDGVLNSEFSSTYHGRYVGIDDDKLNNLKKIVDATGAKIVISSSWRLDYTQYNGYQEGLMNYLLHKFGDAGMIVFDCTPELSKYGDCRGREINDWLTNYQEQEVDNFIVIDDDWFSDFPFFDIPKHLIRTNYYGKDGGLNAECTEMAIRMLQDDASRFNNRRE